MEEQIMKKSAIYMLGALLVTSLHMSVGLANGDSYAKTKDVKIMAKSSVVHNGINDATIVANIKEKIRDDPLLKKVTIEISSSYGNVTLSGLVDTVLQAEKIVIFSQANKWVKAVDSRNLKVKNSKMPLTDTYVTAKVKGMLIRNNLLDITAPGSIQVETKDKVVYLSGKVNRQEQITEIINSVKSVQGVSNIQNGLTISK